MQVHAVRLRPGVDLLQEIERLTASRPLRAGFVLTCVGSLSQIRLRMPGAVGEEEVFRTWPGPMEILSLAGTLCPDGLHLHIALVGRDGRCIGGHLASGCVVNTTAELVIGEAPHLQFSHPLDAETGYDELEIRELP